MGGEDKEDGGSKSCMAILLDSISMSGSLFSELD